MIILNESEYANERLRKNDIGDNPYITVIILAKYYYSIGIKKKEIRTMLHDFLKSTYPRYTASMGEWSDTIEKIVATINKYPLFESDGVWVTKCELKTISELKNTILEKLAFTMLCLAKYQNQKFAKNNNWVNFEIKDIFDMAGVKCANKLRAKRIGDLIRKGMVKFANRIDNLNLQVLFIDDDDEKTLHISDFRELGNEYLLYQGGDFIRCAECGRLVKDNKFHNKKYCDCCATYTPIKTKVVTCVDCGNAFIVSSTNNKTVRCQKCQSEYRKAKDRERKQRSRNNSK